VYIIRLLELPGGIDAVLGFAHIIAEGTLGREDALLWGAAVLEPVDCGPAPAALEGERQSGVRGRKLRPIGLSEVLVKFAECCAIEEELARIKSVLEPAQLGAVTPDGCAIAVRVLRGWCEDIAVGRHEPDVVVAALDLENAFGRMRRSSALAAMRERVPGLYRMLAAQWRHGAVRAWQRVGGGWRLDMSACGGWQGSRLTQIAFAVDLSVRLAGIGMVRDRAVQCLSIADDTYVVGRAGVIAEQWPALQAGLEASNHRLRAHKCKFRAPAEAVEGVRPDTWDALAALVPRVRGGLPALGTAMQGECEVMLGPAACTMEPAKKRLAAAQELCRALREMAEARPHELAHAVVWTLLQKVAARALDFDCRVCPSEALYGILDALAVSVRAVAASLLPDVLDEQAWRQMQLPGRLGEAHSESPAVRRPTQPSGQGGRPTLTMSRWWRAPWAGRWRRSQTREQRGCCAPSRGGGGRCDGGRDQSHGGSGGAVRGRPVGR